MKKHLYFLAAGILTLSACTSEEVVDVNSTNGNVIGFQNIVGKSSRVVDGDLDNSTFDNFLVYGYYLKPGMTTPIQIFNGVSVHKDKTTGVWSYDDKRYWVPNCTYYFYAYSCADIALISTNKVGTPTFSLFDAQNNDKDNRALTLSGYVCDAAHQHDLVTAENEDVPALEKNNEEVKLKFTHALCKVKAEFVTDFPKEYKVYVSNIYISSFYNKADFNVGTGNWSQFTTKDDNDPRVNLNVPANSFVVNAANSKLATSEVFLIPKAYATTENARLHFTIDLKKEIDTPEGKVEETILQRNIVGTWSPQWEKGKIFKYNINISGSSTGIEPIVFAAEQSLEGASDWDDSTQVKMEFGVDANTNTISE